MTQINMFKDCQFCCQLSKANGEDPIGSAVNYDHFIFIELPEPWSKNTVYEHPQLGVIHKMGKALRQESKIHARVMAIAPDYDSNPNQIRVLYYRRPIGSFAQFEKQEFLISPEDIISLATALLGRSDELSQFESYRCPTNDLRDMMICTHGSYDMACGRFGYPIYRKIREAYSNVPLRIWKCTHIGGHQFAPTLLDLPTGHYWGHLETEILDLLIYRQGSVGDLRPFYRGWAGLDWAEQIAEREIWIKEGWEWLSYLKSGETLAISDPEADYPEWAEVKINFCKPDGSERGIYEARIEAHREVETMWNSGDPDSIETIKQYQVTRLIKSSCK